ncbi:MAG: hypothetical protein ACE3L7_02005 [Candidatus Pristimantibacillus sp.]
MNVIWRTEWAQEFETPWSIFEKLSYCNRINRNKLLRFFGSKETRQIKNNKIGDKRRELFQLTGFDIELLTQAIELNLFRHNISTINQLIAPLQHFNRLSQFKWFYQNLRWCECCIRSGYHSWWHQFILVDKCPFHDLPLIDSCRKCNKIIPFLLNDSRFSKPFECSCGYCLADFSLTTWNSWSTKYTLSDISTLTWLDDKWRKEHNNNLVIYPKQISVELLTMKNPTFSIGIKRAQHILDWEYINSNEFKNRLYKENRRTFLSIEKHIMKKYLGNHHHCLEQFWWLKKEIGSEFPKICPYAYAFVFWRYSLLNLDRFYRRNFRYYDFNDDGQLITELLSSEINFLIDEFVSQIKGKYADDALFIILNRYTSQFCLNYYTAWLDLAGEMSDLTALSQSSDNMKIDCLPQISFRYQVTLEEINRVECYVSPKFTTFSDDLQCPNRNSSLRKKIRSMVSFTPEKVAMDVYDSPTDENLSIQKYVDRYVAKLK